ncbi:MAG: ATP-binding protein, partial [Candidatus Limnocylindria bacterium]
MTAEPRMPTGTVTFLMTDIEGSTRLWEERPGPMARALATHDAMLHGAIRAHDGTLVKTTGDGALAVFERPDAALAAASDAQRALARHTWTDIDPLRVRMAVHTGSAQLRDDDYFGPALNRVSRLLAVGNGGQILASAVAAELARDAAVPGELVDRGEHRLRDLDRAEHVFQLIVPDLPSDLAPLRSLATYRTNLVPQLTSFIGRERELADVRARAESHRLVTLIGVGGTGKTRLMLQVGAELLDRYADGVWVVELATVTDPAVIGHEVARALGVGEEPRRPVLDTLVDFLRSKSLLLLLDNCEHVIGSVADLAERLLASAPGLSVIASSREALGVAGEVVFQVPSLGVPPETDSHDEHSRGEAWLERVRESEAVRLFIDRATTVSPSFAVTPPNAGAVVEICRRLDGIPLAIELAA